MCCWVDVGAIDTAVGAGDVVVVDVCMGVVEFDNVDGVDCVDVVVAWVGLRVGLGLRWALVLVLVVVCCVDGDVGVGGGGGGGVVDDDVVADDGADVFFGIDDTIVDTAHADDVVDDIVAALVGLVAEVGVGVWVGVANVDCEGVEAEAGAETHDAHACDLPVFF